MLGARLAVLLVVRATVHHEVHAVVEELEEPRSHRQGDDDEQQGAKRWHGDRVYSEAHVTQHRRGAQALPGIDGELTSSNL